MNRKNISLFLAVLMVLSLIVPFASCDSKKTPATEAPTREETEAPALQETEVPTLGETAQETATENNDVPSESDTPAESDAPIENESITETETQNVTTENVTEKATEGEKSTGNVTEPEKESEPAKETEPETEPEAEPIVVPATNTELFKYCGTWQATDPQNPTTMVSYWDVAYVEIDFEGYEITLMFSSKSTFKYKIDDKSYISVSNVEGDYTVKASVAESTPSEF